MELTKKRVPISKHMGEAMADSVGRINAAQQVVNELRESHDRWVAALVLATGQDPDEFVGACAVLNRRTGDYVLEMTARPKQSVEEVA